MRRISPTAASIGAIRISIRVPVSGLLNRAICGAAAIHPIWSTRRRARCCIPVNRRLTKVLTPRTIRSSDAEGNAVAGPTRLNDGYGSGVTATKLGFCSTTKGDFAATAGRGERLWAVQGEANAYSAQDTLLDDADDRVRDGKLYLVVGSPGGPTSSIRSSRCSERDRFRHEVAIAVDAPRLHHQWIAGCAEARARFSPDTVALLKARGPQRRKLKTGRAKWAAIRVW